MPNIRINKIITIGRSSLSVTSCLVTKFLSLSILMGTWFYLTRFRVMGIGLYYILVCEVVDDATRVIFCSKPIQALAWSLERRTGPALSNALLQEIPSE